MTHDPLTIAALSMTAVPITQSDVGEQRARAEAEQIRPQPAVAQLVLHQRQPVQRVLGGANPTGRLEPDQLTGALAVVANGACHDQTDGERGVDAFLSG